MSIIILSDRDLECLWKSKFAVAKSVTAEDTLILTIYRGKELDDLLHCLDGSILPGIYRKVVERFLNQEVKKMLPKAVLGDPQFELMFSDLIRYYGVFYIDSIRALCTKRFIKDVNQESPENVKRAMIAYIEFGLGNFMQALSDAEFAVNESRVSNFGYEINQRTFTAMNALAEVAKITATIILEVACEMQAAK